jgi:hypothetical protein
MAQVTLMASARPFQVMATASSGQVVLNLLSSPPVAGPPLSRPSPQRKPFYEYIFAQTSPFPAFLSVHQDAVDLRIGISLRTITQSPTVARFPCHPIIKPPYSELINTWQQRLDVHICRARLHQAGIVSQLSNSFFFKGEIYISSQ